MAYERRGTQVAPLSGTYLPLVGDDATSPTGTFYAKHYPGATDDAKFQAALNAAVAAGGGDVVIPATGMAWTGSTPTLPDLTNYAGTIRIRGAYKGAKITLSTAAPRLLDFARTADYQAFGQLEIERLTVDANHVDSHDHVVIGTMIANATQQRVNMRDIYVHDIDVINAPTNALASPNNQRVGIMLVSWHPADNEATQTYVKDVRVERFRMRRNGSGGVLVGATGGTGGHAINCLVDNITIKDSEATCFAAFLAGALDVSTLPGTITVDDTSGFPTAGSVNAFSVGVQWTFAYTGKTSTTLTGVTITTGPGTGTIPAGAPIGLPVTASFEIGNFGIGGTYTVENLIGGYTGDDVFEFNAPTLLNARNLQSEVTKNQALYLHNYNAPLHPAEQVINVENVTHREPYTKTAPSVVVVGTNPGAKMGTLNLDRVRAFITADNNFGGAPGRLLNADAATISHLNFRRLSIDWGVTGAATGVNAFAINLNPSGACTVTADQLRVGITGATTTGSFDPTVVPLNLAGSDLTVFIDRPRFSVTATGISASKVRNIDVGSYGSANKVQGEIRSLKVVDMTGQTTPVGIRIAASTNLTLDQQHTLRVPDPDFTGLPSGSAAFGYGTTTMAQFVFAYNIRWANNGTQAATTPSVGASPYTFTNQNGYAGVVTVQGGTVTQIAIESNGTMIDTGLTQGAFVIGNGRQIKVTYSVAPTMKFLPTTL